MGISTKSIHYFGREMKNIHLTPSYLLSKATGFLKNYDLNQPVSASPLAIFRILFGTVMFFSIVRFMLKGWVYDLYILPTFYFPYYGFEWIKPLSAEGMYLLFGLMAAATLFVVLGLFYRIATVLFFLAFTYVELIDKTNYLNHYYFVSIIAFLLIFVPAHRYISLDCFIKPEIRRNVVPRWCIDIFKLQLGIVYLYAGLAKINADWLLEAMPLKIWLPAHTNIPIIGGLMDETWVACAFSWVGAFYDLTVPFFLLNRKTRPLAYIFVIVFHVVTWLLFPIGMFPWIMIVSTLIFFSSDSHERIIDRARDVMSFCFSTKAGVESRNYDKEPAFDNIGRKLIFNILAVHFLIQVIFPWRYLLYPSDLFWTEQGYRFSWRVMLMEKVGMTVFHVKDLRTGKNWEATNADYLTRNQEKMMASQPDMILQFAHFLNAEYRGQGFDSIAITAESYVTLNGSGSRPFIKREVNLLTEKESFLTKEWILPFEKTDYLTLQRNEK